MYDIFANSYVAQVASDLKRPHLWRIRESFKRVEPEPFARFVISANLVAPSKAPGVVSESGRCLRRFAVNTDYGDLAAFDETACVLTNLQGTN
jgi:hypothetical protein